MIPVLSKTIDYTILTWCEITTPYPYLRSEHGDKTMWQVSPIHGRSYVVDRTGEGRYVVSKGNGLGYTQYNFVYTPEMPTDVWGLLLKEDALRDFHCGQEVQALGISRLHSLQHNQYWQICF